MNFKKMRWILYGTIIAKAAWLVSNVKATIMKVSEKESACENFYKHFALESRAEWFVISVEFVVRNLTIGEYAEFLGVF